MNKIFTIFADMELDSIYTKNMIKRDIHKKIVEMSEKFPVISITGPRQSGKTTLAKMCFPKYLYYNLENPETRQFAITDPKSFLKDLEKGIIVDEAQNVPELFSYIQVMVDEKQPLGKVILTGSQNFLMAEKITQSLAGRVAVFKLLPFSINELKKHNISIDEYETFILKGMYPRLWDREIDYNDYYPQYIQTYIERDVRNIKNITNINTFSRFLQLAASRAGQIINFTSLANDVGVDVKTIQGWFSILEASYVTFFLPAFHKNYNKRIVKSPKLYFYDTGVVCSLLGVHSQGILDTHPFKGNVFENFVISELMKELFNQHLNYKLYYWRDSTGNEIDCVIEMGVDKKIIEVKSSKTIQPDFFKNLMFFQKLSDTDSSRSFLIYGDDNNSNRSIAQIISWNDIKSILK